MPQDDMSVAIIGTGGISGAHLNGLTAMDGVTISGVCDIDDSNARKAADRTGAQVFADFNEMLDKVACDAVFLFTPQMVREAPIAACARRKLPVFTEKPPAFDLETGGRIANVIGDSGIMVSVGFLFRYLKIVERTLQLIGERPIFAMRLLYGCPMMYPDGRGKLFYYQKEVSGGLIVDQAIHLLDITRYILGDEIGEVHAYGANILQPKTAEITTEETVAMNMRSATGVPVSYFHTWTRRKWVAEVEVLAEDACIKLDMFGNSLAAEVDDMTVSYAPGDDCMVTEDRVFLDAVAANAPEMIRSTYPDSLRSLALALTLSRAAERGTIEKVTA